MSRDSRAELRGSAFQVSVDPLFQLAAALVIDVKANTEGVLGLLPGGRALDPDTRQGQQGKRNFDRLTGTNFFSTSQGHAAGADFDTGGVELALVELDRNFRHHRNTDVATKFMQHQ